MDIPSKHVSLFSHYENRDPHSRFQEQQCHPLIVFHLFSLTYLCDCLHYLPNPKFYSSMYSHFLYPYGLKDNTLSTSHWYLCISKSKMDLKTLVGGLLVLSYACIRHHCLNELTASIHSIKSFISYVLSDYHSSSIKCAHQRDINRHDTTHLSILGLVWYISSKLPL